MVFNMRTLDLTRGLDEDFPPASLSTSPSRSATFCCTDTFALAASTTIEFACWRKLTEPVIKQHKEEIQIQQGLLSKFTLEELQAATGNFSNKNILRRGGFGKVYRGQLANGYVVAIKRCGQISPEMEQFQAEVKMGNMCNHRNVAPLLGFYMSSKLKEYMLVYPFSVNGSVAACLRGRTKSQPPLSWDMRMKIALGVARGLRHLHHLNIIHRDIKASNILLDERFEPLIGDFGFALFAAEKYKAEIERAAESERGSADAAFSNSRTTAQSELEDTTVETAVWGTIGHIAPEYLTKRRCSKKNDIFGYGIMLLELITGQRVLDLPRLANNKDVMLLDWVEGLLLKEERFERLIDADLRGDYDEGEVEKLIKIALMCTQRDPKGRPNAVELVQFVKGNGWYEKWENYQEDYINMPRKDQQLKPAS